MLIGYFIILNMYLIIYGMIYTYHKLGNLDTSILTLNSRLIMDLCLIKIKNISRIIINYVP